MSDLVAVERELAGVLTLPELAGGVLDRVKAIAGASDAMVFAFDHAGFPNMRGPLADVMRGYTADMFREDFLQAYSRALPRNTFITDDRGDFDVRGHLRSRTYADFYRPNGIGWVFGLWPTGIAYAAPGMFGIFLCTPSMSRRPDAATHERLGRLEAALRVTARRIARFSALENERSVLRGLIGLDRGAFVVWDQDGRMAWVSPEAATLVRGKSESAELQRVAAVAARQLRGRPDARPSLFAQPTRIDARRGGAFLAEFCLIPTSDGQPWLVAELSACDGPQARLAALTAAERRVLALLVRGLRNREIGAALFVSTETVRTHVSRILHKLAVDTRSKAASLARQAWGRPHP